MTPASLAIPLDPRFSRWSSTASLLLLYALATASALYLLQRYVPFPFSAESRFALFVLLMIVALGFKRKLFAIPLPFWGLGVAVGWTGLHTYILSDLHLALYSTARYANVMMLAPLAAVLLIRGEQLLKVFQIFLVIFLVALASLLFQHWGGQLDSLTLGYIAIRGDLVRHMTVVGEPNVGGMLAALAFVMGIMLPRRRGIAIALGAMAVAFIIFSLSKAAMLGLCVAGVAAGVVLRGDERRDAFLKATIAGFLGLLLLWVLGGDDYIRVAVESVMGGIRGEPSALEDLKARQSMFDSHAASGSSGMPASLTYLLGASFVGVGSAALEIRGPNSSVVLPHNSYLEMFLTGGFLMLGIVLFLMARAYRVLWRSTAPHDRSVDRCALICLTALSSWMLVFPVIYEPVTGCLFWIIVGYGNRRNAHPSAAVVQSN